MVFCVEEGNLSENQTLRSNHLKKCMFRSQLNWETIFGYPIPHGLNENMICVLHLKIMMERVIGYALNSFYNP